LARRRVFTETRSPVERFFRVMALMAVLAVTVVLYQRHFDNALDRIQSKTSIWDQAGILDDESREYVKDVSRDLRRNFGLELRVWARTEPFESPDLDAKTIFIGVYVPGRAAMVIFPPLVAKALDPDFRRFLEEDHFSEYFKKDDPATGMLAAVGLIYQALTDDQSGGAPGEKGDGS